MCGPRYSCASLLFGFTLLTLMFTGWMEMRIFVDSLDLPFEERGKCKEYLSVVFVTYYYSLGTGALVAGVLGLLGVGDISKSLSLKILLFGISSLSSFMLYVAYA